MVCNTRFSTTDSFFTCKIVMLKGKHINAYLLDLNVDFIVEKVEYQREQKRAAQVLLTPKRR
jgi:hypothetical protein